eukprot:2643788-Rhodomonas_salina.2
MTHTQYLLQERIRLVAPCARYPQTQGQLRASHSRRVGRYPHTLRQYRASRSRRVGWYAYLIALAMCAPPLSVHLLVAPYPSSVPDSA